MTISADAPRSTVPRIRPRLSRREDLLTVAFSTWVIVGLFVDGWAHNNDKPESFFTPWHGPFYSGFTATARWMWSRYRRHHGVPVGYGLGFVGVVAFAAGGGRHVLAHDLRGRAGPEVLLSPSHLLLFASWLLIGSSPLRPRGPTRTIPRLRPPCSSSSPPCCRPRSRAS